MHAQVETSGCNSYMYVWPTLGLPVVYALCCRFSFQTLVAGKPPSDKECASDTSDETYEVSLIPLPKINYIT